MRHEFGVPTVRRVIGWWCCDLELLGLVIRPKRAALGTERAGAAGELGWNFPRNGKGSFAAMAASGNGHVSLLSVVGNNAQAIDQQVHAESAVNRSEMDSNRSKIVLSDPRMPRVQQTEYAIPASP